MVKFIQKWIWVIGAALLLVLAIEYTVLRTLETKNAVPGVIAALILVVLVILFVVEGAEIAAVGLSDKDPDQIDEESPRNSLIRLKEALELFFTGRQLIVVSLIVWLTFLSGDLASIEPITDRNGILKVSTSKAVTGLFAFAFPTFIVLWFAQLLPKFLAQENPLRMFSWPITRAFLYVSISLGKTQLGFPSQLVKKGLGKWMPVPNRKLLPSRPAHYQAAATLRHGRGVCYNRVNVVVGLRGEVHVSSEYCYEAFGPGFDKVTVWHGWVVPIDGNSCKFNVVDKPAECGESTVYVPRLSDFECPSIAGAPPRKVTNGKVEWEVHFQRAVPVGKTFTCTAEHKTGDGACEVTSGKDDDYVHTVRTPTTLLTFFIKPANDVPIVLVGGACDAEMTGEREVDAKEAKRVNITPCERGYKFEVEYPLEGTRLKFKWKVGSQQNITSGRE